MGFLRYYPLFIYPIGKTESASPGVKKRGVSERRHPFKVWGTADRSQPVITSSEPERAADRLSGLTRLRVRRRGGSVAGVLMSAAGRHRLRSLLRVARCRAVRGLLQVLRLSLRSGRRFLIHLRTRRGRLAFRTRGCESGSGKSESGCDRGRGKRLLHHDRNPLCVNALPGT